MAKRKRRLVERLLTEDTPPKPLDKNYLREVAKVIDTKLPDQTGWIFMASAVGEDQPMQYMSNIDRETAIKVLKEFLFNAGEEENWMKHIR